MMAPHRRRRGTWRYPASRCARPLGHRHEVVPPPAIVMRLPPHSAIVRRLLPLRTELGRTPPPGTRRPPYYLGRKRKTYLGTHLGAGASSKAQLPEGASPRATQPRHRHAHSTAGGGGARGAESESEEREREEREREERER